MHRLCVFIPETYIETLDMFVAENRFPNRSEAIRVAIRNLIKQEVQLDQILAEKKRGVNENPTFPDKNIEKQKVKREK